MTDSKQKKKSILKQTLYIFSKINILLKKAKHYH